MAKKSIKAEDLLDLIQHDDRIIDAIMLRIEAKLTSTIEKIMDKLATAMMEKTEVIIDQKLDQKLQTLTAQFNDKISEEAKQNQHLRTKVDELETYQILDYLIIHGLTISPSVSPDENNGLHQQADLPGSLLALFNESMGLTVQDVDIVKTQLMLNKSKAHRPILVQFANRRIRDCILSARKGLKHYQVGGSRVFINEYLTHRNAELFAEARKLVKQKVLYATWTRDGRIFIKSSESSTDKPKKVTSMSDLPAS